MKRLVILLVLLMVAVGIFTFVTYFSPPEELAAPVVEETSSENVVAGAPTFEWSYATSTRADIPYSEISLIATYPGGATQTKAIDTIAGGCNAYEDADADVYQGSTMIICYYAGLGHYYKVVESSGAYLVQRKVFEEASPEYDPPVEEFETVARF